MQRWSHHHRSFAVEAFLLNNESFVATRRAFRTRFNLPPRAVLPNNRSISRWVRAFRETGNVTPKSTVGRPFTAVTSENVERVQMSVEDEMNCGTFESIVIKEESLEHIYLPEEPSHNQETKDFSEHEFIKVESYSPDPSSQLLQPIIKEEAGDPIGNDEQMTFLSASSERRRFGELKVKNESDDFVVWKDEPIDSNSWNTESSKLRKKVDLSEMQGTKRKIYITDTIRNASNKAGEFLPVKPKFVCDNCGKVYLRKKYLIRHLSTEGEKPLECRVCKKCLTSKKCMMIHKLIHVKRKSHACTACDKTFPKISALKDHMSIHTRKKNHECSACGRAFGRRKSLLIHMKEHTGEKPHECSICKTAFKTAIYLMEHMLIHTGQKHYECNICGRTFATGSGARTHKLIHAHDKPEPITKSNE